MARDNGGAVHGNTYLRPFLGGSGGGGGTIDPGFAGDACAASGGAGGGALVIASSAGIRVSGSIVADGGAGGSGNSFQDRVGNGGGGSGGAILLQGPEVAVTGALYARGGSAAAYNGVTGSGAPGRIRVESFKPSLTGTISPSPTLATPSAPLLPTNLSAPLILIDQALLDSALQDVGAAVMRPESRRINPAPMATTR